ncbi:MAG: TonB-dependent receptor domain-containing protein [Cyclonatronaceae bacterium]
MMMALLLMALPATNVTFASSPFEHPNPITLHTKSDSRVLSGVVRDAETGDVLPGATLQLSGGAEPGLNMNDVSGPAGQFQFVLPDSFAAAEDKPLRLSVSFIGYERMQRDVYPHEINQEMIEVALVPATYGMSPVNVVAHHSMRAPAGRLNPDEASVLSIDSGAFLRSAENVSGVRRGGFALDPVVRGHGGSRLNIRVDGLVSSAAACPNRMDPPTSHIRLSDVERVEIHHGPHALQYGPAFGGTVDFVRHSPADMRDRAQASGQPLQADVRLGYESNTGNRISDARVNWIENRWSLMLSGGLSGTDDYTDGEGQSVQSGFHSSDYGIEAGVQLSQNQRLSAAWNQSFVRDADYPALSMDMAMDDTYKLKAGYAWNLPSSGGLREIKLDAYHSFVDHEMNNHNRDSFAMRDAVALAETGTSGFKFSASGLYSSTRWNLVANLDDVIIDGTRFVDFKTGPRAGESMQYNLWQDSRITNAGLYAGAEQFYGPWSLSAGARFDYNRADARHPAPRFEGRDLSSEHINISLSTGVSREFGTQNTLSLYVGRGVRSPDVTERFLNFLAVGRDPVEFAGNPELEPEINNQADIVFDRRSASGLDFRLNAFASLTQDYISGVIAPELEPVGMNAPAVREFRNRGDAFFTGFEGRLGYGFSNLLRAEWSASYTYGEYLSGSTAGSDDAGAVAEIPPLESTLRLSSVLGSRFTPQAEIRRVFPQGRYDEAFGETRTAGFWLVDIESGIRLYQQLDLNAGVRNLFDEAYSEHLNRSFNPEFTGGTGAVKLMEPGRRAFVELNWRF